MKALLHSPPKTSTMAASTSSWKVEVYLFDGSFLWSSNIGRAMKLAPLKICHKVLPLNYSRLKVSFSVTRRRKQGTGQLYFPPLLTRQSIRRFISFTCGFICQSKYIKSNIGFGQDKS